MNACKPDVSSIFQTGLSVEVWVLTAAKFLLKHGDQPADSDDVSGPAEYQRCE